MKFLHDTLFGFKYPDAIWKSIPKSCGIGVFLELDVGKGYSFADEVGSRGYAFLRGHTMWKDRHDFSLKDLPEIQHRAAELNQIAKKHPKTQYYVSTGCEHALDADTAAKFVEGVKHAAPLCAVVNVPENTGALVKGVINECHGSIRKGCNAYSADGVSSVDSNITALKAAAKNFEYFGIWDPQENMKAETDDTTPRPKRTITPSSDLLKSLVALQGEKGATMLPKGWIYKSHAEKQKTPDPRSDKPVMLCPVKVDVISLMDKKNVLAELKYYGPYGGGGYRYYGSVMGFEIATRPVSVVAGGRIYGTVNPAFRGGLFRG